MRRIESGGSTYSMGELWAEGAQKQSYTLEAEEFGYTPRLEVVALK